MSVSEKVSLSDALSNVDVLDELTLPGKEVFMLLLYDMNHHISCFISTYLDWNIRFTERYLVPA